MNQGFAYDPVKDRPYRWANCWTACEDMCVMDTGKYPHPYETANAIKFIGGYADVWLR
jgi:hypothetical protein